MKEIANRYGDQIETWDVANELIARKPQVIMPLDYVYKTFKEAERDFPTSSTFLINETPQVWFDFKHEYGLNYLLIQNLLLRGAKIDAIGIQMHIFSETTYNAILDGKLMQPQQMFEVLDNYSDLLRPIHITEITIPTIPGDSSGEVIQATIVENFYKLWFSHPNVEAFTWWNIADGTAYGTEDKWKGGFLNKYLSPKASYHVLDRLINHEWRTNIEHFTYTDKVYSFKAFYGQYTLTYNYKGKSYSETLHLGTGKKDFVIELE